MGCYLCKSEDVTTDADSLCDFCRRFTCGPPPVRHDHRFHGDECGGCGVFFCERHMHGHPKSAPDVSGLFPRLCLPIAADAVAAASTLEGVGTSDSNLATTSGTLGALNRYLNAVSPGETALIENWSNLPKDVCGRIVDD